MTLLGAYVVDASVVIKWVVCEPDTEQAIAFARRTRFLCAPDVIAAECANVLWKKVRRGHMSREEALIAARTLEKAEIEIAPTRTLLTAATALAMELDHPAYDCVYLALARERGLKLATADDRLLRKLSQNANADISELAIPLAAAAAEATGGRA